MASRRQSRSDRTRAVVPRKSRVAHLTVPKDNELLVRYWGVRGSLSTPGPRTIRYGGNTPCVEIRCGKTLIIIDAGTGIRQLGNALIAEFKDDPIIGHILVTHPHQDHIEGFRFFAPALDPGHNFTVYGSDDATIEMEDQIETQLETTYFPATVDEIGVEIEFKTVDVGTFFVEDVAVTAMFLNHPGVCYGYRLSWKGRDVVHLSDTEPYQYLYPISDDTHPSSNSSDQISNHLDRRLIRFVEGADLLTCDAQFDQDEYQSKRGWGHSSVDDAVRIAIEGGVRRLALFHHDPSHEDDKIDAMLAHARQMIRRSRSKTECFAAQEGLELLL